mgnify:CR=1 FL=1
MAEETKTKETKSKQSQETKASVDQLAINNKQAQDIADLQSENLRLKDMVGRASKKKAAKQAPTSIVGLKGLQGFGRK